ncbi:hypothetical protein LCM4577_07415 [Mesorhizobium sp. LCM 4577]|nr:hypothetical protein LCM4577_07415 [Mesorhizobium sp. LCM 4577]
MQESRAVAHGKLKQVERSDHAGAGRVNRVGLVTGRRRRACQVKNMIDRLTELERSADILLDQPKLRLADKGGYVFHTPGEKVVDTDHSMALGKQGLA